MKGGPFPRKIVSLTTKHEKTMKKTKTKSKKKRLQRHVYMPKGKPKKLVLSAVKKRSTLLCSRGHTNNK